LHSPLDRAQTVACVHGLGRDLMAYAFDGSGFGQFLVDAQRLIAGARDHERHLASLVAALEHERARVGASPIEAAAVGSLAGMLVLPTELGLHPNAMDIVFVSSFTAAVVGGLDSTIGAVAGGLIVGLLLSYVSGYAGATVAPIAVLLLLVVVLLGRPGGLFSRSAARAV